jgi:hypothetical protein
LKTDSIVFPCLGRFCTKRGVKWCPRRPRKRVVLDFMVSWSKTYKKKKKKKKNTGRDRKRQGTGWHDVTWLDMTWHDLTWPDLTWHFLWHDFFKDFFGKIKKKNTGRDRKRQGTGWHPVV